MNTLDIKGPGLQSYTLRDADVAQFLKLELATVAARNIQNWMSVQFEEPQIVVGANVRIGANGPTIYEVVKLFTDADGAECALIFDEATEDAHPEHLADLVVAL